MESEEARRARLEASLVGRALYESTLREAAARAREAERRSGALSRKKRRAAKAKRS